MPAAALLAATVVAVLCPREVALVDVGSASVVRHFPLISEGVAVFAAPDGRIVIPLREDDTTAVIAVDGRQERWPGRVFPMFFADYDRMHVAMPGLLATLSYPERIPLEQFPLEGVTGVRRAACSRDGRLVAVIPSDPGSHEVILVAALEGGTHHAVPLPGGAALVTVADDGGFVAVATSGPEGEVLMVGQGRTHGEFRLTGEVRSMCLGPEGRDVLVGLADGALGELVDLKVDVSARAPLKERFRTRLESPPVALAAAGGEVTAVIRDSLVILGKAGRRVRARIAMPGAYDIAALPSEPKTTLPEWSDRP